MLIKPGYKKFWNTAAVYGKAAGGVAFSLVYTAGGKGASSNTALTTQSYGTLNWTTNSRIVAVVLWYPGGVVSGVSVGGNALSPVSGAAVLQGNTAADVWESTGPLAGTSGTVTVTYASAPSFTSAVALYSLQTTTPLASDAKVGSTPAATSVAVGSALTVPAGGGAVVAGFGSNGTAATPVNFTSDVTDATGGVDFVWGHTTATGSVTPSITFAGTEVASISAVAWAP